MLLSIFGPKKVLHLSANMKMILKSSISPSTMHLFAMVTIPIFKIVMNASGIHIIDLHVPWQPDKGNLQFLFVTDYIGFQWDIPHCLVSLPPHKCLKFLERVHVFLDRFSGHHYHLHDIESIHGSLCHVAFVYLDGCSHLLSLSNFMASFKNDEYIMHYPPPVVLSYISPILAYCPPT